MWRHPLATMLAVLGAIPVGSLLLHTDPGGAWAGESGGYDVPPGAGGGEVRGKTIYTYKNYVMKDCHYLYKETALDLNESNHFFEGRAEGETFYRQFVCKDEAIQSVDREWDAETAPEIQSSFWINEIWRDLHIGGKCVSTTKGGLLFEPAVSEEEFSDLSGCLATPAALVNFYEDLYCESRFPKTIQSIRVHGTGDCTDIVNADGSRKGQTYECLNHALVERRYGDYLGCNEKSIQGKESVWTYERWKMWVTGSCVQFDNLVSAKISHQAISDEAIQAVEATECGNPMAELILYTAPGCDRPNILLTQELVAEGEDCVFMTSHRARRSLKLTKACGEDFYGLFAYLNNRCSFIPYWAVKLSAEEHDRFRAEECMETTEIYAGIPAYFKLVVKNRDRPPFETSVNTCTTTTTVTTTVTTATTATTSTTVTTVTTATTATTATTTTEPPKAPPPEEPVKAPPPEWQPPEFEPPPEWNPPPEWGLPSE